MTLRINDKAPDFTAATTHGRLRFHEWMGDSWAVLFSHPKDFTPVCTTELGSLARLAQEFTARNTKVIGLSVDPVEDHLRWEREIQEVSGHPVGFPMIGDADLQISKLYGMLPAEEPGSSQGRTARQNAPVRTVFVIGPDKRIELTVAYPMTTGRNFLEILRVLDSLQLTARHQVATPADWQDGEDVIITPAVSDHEATILFSDFTTVKPYLRFTKQPLSTLPTSWSPWRPQ